MPLRERASHDSLRSMEAVISPLPDDVEALKALLVSALQKADEAEAKLANAHARESAIEALIAHLKLQIAKLKREQYGPSAERSRRLLDQMELQLEELEADAAEDDLIAEEAAAKRSPHKPGLRSGRDHAAAFTGWIPGIAPCVEFGGEAAARSAKRLGVLSPLTWGRSRQACFRLWHLQPPCIGSMA